MINNSLLRIKCNECNCLNSKYSSTIKDRITAFKLKCLNCNSYLINDQKIIINCRYCNTLNRIDYERINDKPICGKCKNNIIDDKDDKTAPSRPRKNKSLIWYNFLTLFNIFIVIIFIDYYLNKLAFKYGYYYSLLINLLSDLNINNDNLLLLYKIWHEFKYTEIIITYYYLIGFGLTLILYFIGKSLVPFRCYIIPLLLIGPLIFL